MIRAGDGTANITSFSYYRDFDRLSYTPQHNMAFGTHTVMITAKDVQSLSATKTWSFKVVDWGSTSQL